jgi:membrane associated rhomboid family serine protease
MLKKIIFTSLFLSLAILVLATPVKTAVASTTPIIDPSMTGTAGNIPYKTGDYSLNDILNVAIGASRWILGIVGSLTLLMFIYGGLMFLISGGSSDKVGQAKKILTAAVIGLLIVFASYIIIQFVLKAMGLNWSGNTTTMTETNRQANICSTYDRFYS